MNPVYKQGGHGTSNPKIMQIFAGAGNIKSSFSAAWQGVLSTVKGNAIVSLIFSTATSYIEWQTDIKKDGYDFATNLITSILKALLVAIISSLLTAIIILFASLVITGGIPILAVGGLALTLSI
ncbi:MAG: hypothetical protein K2Q15_10855, partial [Burkholderiales bacterium]|nr:hypothetical protein [Burkholderiales bacterium]